MPKISAVKREYNLPEIGQSVGGAVVRRFAIQHKVVKRYRKYDFPFSFTLEGKGGVSKLSRMLRGRHIVYSPYGNPYACEAELEKSGSGNRHVIRGVIHCERVFTKKNPKPISDIAYVNCYVRQSTAEKRTKGTPYTVVPKMLGNRKVIWCVVDPTKVEVDFNLYHPEEVK